MEAQSVDFLSSFSMFTVVLYLERKESKLQSAIELELILIRRRGHCQDFKNTQIKSHKSPFATSPVLKNIYIHQRSLLNFCFSTFSTSLELLKCMLGYFKAFPSMLGI